MRFFQYTRKTLSLLLAIVMIMTILPFGTIAADYKTVFGPSVTIQANNDSLQERENSFNEDWKFFLGDNSNASNKNFDDSSWENVNLPHDFSIIQNFTSSGEAESGFLPGGTGWYRKTFTAPVALAGKTVLLNFDGVYMNATVYVNGTEIGTHNYGYTNFAFDITDHLICDGATENVIAVKNVNNIPTSRWYSGSGIYRDVTLLVLDPVHVDLNGVTVTTPNVADNDGTVNVQVDVVNNGTSDVSLTVTNTVYKKNSSNALASDSKSITVPAGTTATANSAPVVNNPALWSVEDPNLYLVKTEINVDGTIVDTCETEFGFRWFEFNSSGFHLNGEPVKLNGVCLHHDQGALGSAAYYDAMYRQLSIMKNMGCNAIRTSHNPADEDFIAICNELGLLVIEEAFDGLVDYKNENTNDFSKYFESAADSNLYGYTSGMNCAEYAARSMVKRDKNAPSVIAWSFGNEIQEGTYWTNVSRYDDICANFISWVKDEDETRPVTSGDNNRGGDADLVNVINTITNSGGIAGFNYANSAATLNSLAQDYGGTKGVIIASETSSATNSRGQYRGQDSNSNIDGAYHLTSYDTSSVGWGITAHDSIYNTYQYDCVAGEFVWTGFDYIGEPTPWNGTTSGDSGRGAKPNSSYFGIVETTGFEKDTYYLYRSQWNKEDTTVHLVTSWDNENMITNNGMTPVWLYSNAPRVDLYLNNSWIASATRNSRISDAGHTYYTYSSSTNNPNVCTVLNGYNADALYGVFNVAYTAGTLTAKAYDANNNEIALDDSAGRYIVTTPGTASKLVASKNKSEIAADGSSLVYISVDVTDADGNLDTTASNEINFTLSGPGVILGVDNGDQATTNKYQQKSVLTSTTSAKINAYAGKALVIVRSTDESGTIGVEVTSAGFESSAVSVKSTAQGNSEVDGLISYTMVKDYSVFEGDIPEFDYVSVGTMSNGTTLNGNIAWDSVPESVYGTAGDYTINGVLTFEGLEPFSVTARLHVIPDVIAMRNVSTATIIGVLPSLPDTVRGVKEDGTLAGEFFVEWDEPNVNEYDTVGEIVTVEGNATILGDVSMPVTCTVRVAEAVNTESKNVALMADSLSQDIPTNLQSDNLQSVLDGVTNPSGDSETDRWTNWNNRFNSPTATITLTWATAQSLSDINLYYRNDGSCWHPESVVFSYSLNGADFINVSATESLISGVSINNGSAYTYALDEVINPVALKITFTQQYGTSGGKCVGLYEIETMTYAASFEYNTSSDLSGITVDGTALDQFNANKLIYEAESDDINATTAVNAGITILPAYNNVIRVLTVSEDGSVAKTYEITVAEDECVHANTEVINSSSATCKVKGYTGDTYCNDCQTVIEKGTVIPVSDHSWGDWSITSAATCTADGEKTRTCSACKDVETVTIQATGHQNTEVINAVTATCKAKGYTGDTYCNDCQTVIEKGTVIPVSDHSWGDWSTTTAASCTDDGEKTRTCSVCQETETETVQATGHQNTVVVGALTPTCTREGYTGDMYCNDCNMTIQTGTVIPVAEHSWDEGVQENESTTYTCTVCGTTKSELDKKAPVVSLKVAKNTSTSRLVLTGQFDDFINADHYYEVTAHGIVYLETTKLGKRVLTINTSGRTRVNFNDYKNDGSFVYNLKPTSKNLSYTIRAFMIYTDTDTGKSVIVYSTPVVTTYNKAAVYTVN